MSNAFFNGKYAFPPSASPAKKDQVCPACGQRAMRLQRTRPARSATVLRYRLFRCVGCGATTTTIEAILHTSPAERSKRYIPQAEGLSR